MSDAVHIRCYLQSSPQLIIGNRLNVRFLKRAVELLPDDMSINDSTSRTLDEISAIVFHTAFPLRVVLAREWVEQHPYIRGEIEQLTGADRVAATNLLTSLGLLKPAEPIKRRI